MAKLTIEGLEASGFEGIIQEGPDAFGGYDGGLPCFVRHRYAGGHCRREAVMQVYDIAFCEVHGAEAKAGALEEIYHDASNALSDASRANDSSSNIASEYHLSIARDEVTSRCKEAEEAQTSAMLAAYPIIEKYVDTETTEHDYSDPMNTDPVDVFWDARSHVYRLMRLSFSVGQHWMLEILEEERQSCTAQLAWAMAYRAQKTGQPV